MLETNSLKKEKQKKIIIYLINCLVRSCMGLKKSIYIKHVNWRL